MTIEHKLIPDVDLHEPKGVASAATGTIYHANGASSGSWKKVDKDSLNQNLFSYGSMQFVANSVNLAVTAVADTTFNTPSQFSVVTGTGAPWAGSDLYNLSFVTDHIIVPVTGVYHSHGYFNIGAFPSSTARICFRYLINGTTYSVQKAIVKSGAASFETQVVGTNIIPLTAGDSIQVVIASDTTGNILLRDAVVAFNLIRQTV